MRVAPGASPAPQSQAQGPQGPGPQQGPSPEQAVQMIQQGFLALGKIIQSAGAQLPPEDIKLFQQAAQATDAMIQSLSGPGGSDQKGPQAPPRPPPGGPMPANASPNSQQAAPQG